MTQIQDPLDHALRLLKAGKLVAIPTETVYGLGADAANPQAIEAVYAAKNRPAYNPLIIHIAHPEAMTEWAIDIPDAAWDLAKAFWPGPLTLILKRHPHVSRRITAGQDSVALRVPNHPLTLALLRAFKGGLIAPSANPYGRISPTTAEHVRLNLGSRVDYILDGGSCSIGIESTILSLLDEQPLILREGAVTATEISKVLNRPITPRGATSASQQNRHIQVPGSDRLHYAPLKSLYVCTKNKLTSTIHHLHTQNQRCDVLSFDQKTAELASNIDDWIQMPNDPKRYAQHLYRTLHQLDQTPSDCIIVEAVPTTEPWNAIRDRLQRASRPLN